MGNADRIDPQIVTEVVGNAQVARHWFFDAQVFLGGTLALMGASLTAWRLYKTTEGEKEKAAEEWRQRKLLIASAIQGEIAFAAVELAQLIKQPATFIGRLKRADLENSTDAFYGNKFYQTHSDEIGILGPKVCRSLEACHRNAQHIILFFVYNRVSMIDNWNTDKGRTEKLIKDRFYDICEFFEATNKQLAEITGEEPEPFPPADFTE